MRGLVLFTRLRAHLSKVAKYVAMCSTKGYAIGRKFLEWMEARLADVDDQSALLGHSEDVLAICGSRMYVFFLDAAPTERLLSQEGSLLTYLQEEADMGAANGGKLRASILKGASSTCMAGVRAMALICDSVFWKMIRAVKPSAEKHVCSTSCRTSGRPPTASLSLPPPRRQPLSMGRCRWSWAWSWRPSPKPLRKPSAAPEGQSIWRASAPPPPATLWWSGCSPLPLLRWRRRLPITPRPSGCLLGWWRLTTR